MISNIDDVRCYNAGEDIERNYFTKELIKFENYKDLLNKNIKQFINDSITNFNE